jgi:hypothetical protein
MSSNGPPRCEGCAFTPGTRANLQEGTLLKARLSALIAEPFYCHANLIAGKLPKGQEKLCIGWADMVSVLYRRGHYERLTDFQRAAMGAAIEVIQTIEDRLLAGEDVENLDVPSEFLKWLSEFEPAVTAAQPAATRPGQEGD